jgi:cell division protein FtsB
VSFTSVLGEVLPPGLVRRIGAVVESVGSQLVSGAAGLAGVKAVEAQLASLRTQNEQLRRDLDVLRETVNKLQHS